MASNTSENIRPSELAVKSESLIESSTHAAQKRLQKELMALMMANDKDISAFPDGDNLFRWIATISGPADTVFAGFKFKLALSFSSKYPYTAPHVVFLTKCFHPNINSDGEICLDILKDKWTALYDVRMILLSIQSLLGEPNLDSPLDSHSASLWGHEGYRDLIMVQYEKSTNAK